MSFQEDCAQFSDQLAQLVDAGVPVKEAAVAVGLPRQRCYAILRAIGQPVGKPRGVRWQVADRDLITAVFVESESISQAAKACGVSHSVARRVLVNAGLVREEPQVRGKPEAKRQCLELIASGWSTTRAAREVGVNERTARDWRQGIRHTRNTRIYPDGRVVDYNDATVYKQPVTVTSMTCTDAGISGISDRYLDSVPLSGGLRIGGVLHAMRSTNPVEN